jgi:hypothetical protein
MKTAVMLILLLTTNLIYALAANPTIQSEHQSVKENIQDIIKDNEFIVYSDVQAQDNHYLPSGWMGDYSDLKLNSQHIATPHSGKTCIEFTYLPNKSQSRGWAGVYWQNPANNWGTEKGGFNLSGMSKLTFWARGKKGGEIIKKFIVGGIKENYPDSAFIELGPVILTDKWRQFTINLAGRDLNYISGGFGWATDLEANPEGWTFYLDDIKYEADPSIEPEARKMEAMPFYVFDDRTSLKNHYIPSGWMGDYNDLVIDTSYHDYIRFGQTCIKVSYNAAKSEGRNWAGVYWQNTTGNWGSVDAGYDLSNARKLTFWAKGTNGNEIIDEFKIGGISGQYSDSDEVKIGPIRLSQNWQKYTINLNQRNMSYIIGGFCFSLNADVNPKGCTFYLDEIKYE